MEHPNKIIEDIQEALDQVVREYSALIEKNLKLETENKALAQSLKEAEKQQEILTHRLDTLHQETLNDARKLEKWKAETRQEVKGIIKEVEKCIPQVESLMERNLS